MIDEAGETVQQVEQGFSELDEAARSRAVQAVASGTEARAAFARESVLAQMLNVYNNS